VIEDTVTTQAIGGVRELTFPENTIAIKEVRYDSKLLSPTEMKFDPKTDLTNPTGVPRQYGVWDDVIYLFPTPASSTVVFTVSGITVSPSVDDVYTNNGGTFTISATSITGGAGTITATQTVGPPATSGNLTVSSGSGDTTIAFSAYTASGDSISLRRYIYPSVLSSNVSPLNVPTEYQIDLVNFILSYMAAKDQNLPLSAFYMQMWTTTVEKAKQQRKKRLRKDRMARTKDYYFGSDDYSFGDYGIPYGTSV
jgi:hypothetical protein